MPAVKKKRRVVKRKLKKEVIFIGFAVILFIYICFSIPGMLSKNKLAKLGYDKEAVTVIKSLGLTKDILDNQWYSDHLNLAIKNENFRKELIELYLVTDSLSSDDLLLYDRLNKSYTLEELLPCFEQLEFYEITPLLIFDHVADLSAYIEDVKTNRVYNSKDHFQLSNSYITYYQNTEPVKNEGSVDMLVNKHFYLSESFVPADLVEMSVRYAAKGIQMSSVAYEAFKSMSDAMSAENLSMYASSTFRDYAYQVDLYDGYVRRDGEEVADTYAARPGFSEHQTGLTADLASAKGGLSKFGETEEYQWMLANAHNYGWILRYPEGKETLTGYEAEPWHWRYVGIELATKVYNSGLTYDEYFMLYLV